VICLGTPRHRRIGLHRDGSIGRATQYGSRLLRLVACVYCDRVRVKEGGL